MGWRREIQPAQLWVKVGKAAPKDFKLAWKAFRSPELTLMLWIWEACCGFLVPRTTPGAGHGGCHAAARVGVSLSHQRCCLCLSRRTDVPGPGSTPAPGRYRNWNPPLLGNLPEDFLRILPQQTAGTQVRLDAPSSPCPGSTVRHGAPNPILGHSELAVAVL